MEVFAIIKADAICRQLLGSNPCRIYAFGEAPQGVKKPYAVWQMVTSTPANYLDQLPDMDGQTIQVDVYADTQDTAQVTALAIRDAVEPFAYLTNSADRGRDSTTRNFGYMLEFGSFTPR